jgi:hypothetical protein
VSLHELTDEEWADMCQFYGMDPRIIDPDYDGPIDAPRDGENGEVEVDRRSIRLLPAGKDDKKESQK